MHTRVRAGFCGTRRPRPSNEGTRFSSFAEANLNTLTRDLRSMIPIRRSAKFWIARSLSGHGASGGNSRGCAYHDGRSIAISTTTTISLLGYAALAVRILNPSELCQSRCLPMPVYCASVLIMYPGTRVD